MKTDPKHVAIIMDGNGRWANLKNLPKIEGHRHGIKVAKNILLKSLEIGIEYLTLYAFSSENWKRPQTEVSSLFNLLSHHLSLEIEDLNKKSIRLKFIGDIDKLDSKLKSQIKQAEHLTLNNNKLTVIIALNYGSRQEIIQAVKNFCKDVQSNIRSISDLTEELFSQYLYTSNIPDPDIIIRTSGEQRLSNFLLWQISYSELYYTDVLWPEFDEKEFLKAIDNYKKRYRRYGNV